jgi:hypothetical protein
MRFQTARFYLILSVIFIAIAGMWYDGATEWSDGPAPLAGLRINHQPAGDEAVNRIALNPRSHAEM